MHRFCEASAEQSRAGTYFFKDEKVSKKSCQRIPSFARTMDGLWEANKTMLLPASSSHWDSSHQPLLAV